MEAALTVLMFAFMGTTWMYRVLLIDANKRIEELERREERYRRAHERARTP